MEVYKKYHYCHLYSCRAPCLGFVLCDAKDDQIIEGWENLIDAEGNTISKTGEAPIGIVKAYAPTIPKPKVEINFFDNCGVAELAAKINLDVPGVPTLIKKSQIKEPSTDTKENQKEATKTAPCLKNKSRKEQLLSKLELLDKENALRRHLISQHAALARSQHALKLRQQRTKLCTAHKFKLGSVLSSNQPFIDDAIAEVQLRRRQQASDAESARHLALVSSVSKLAPAGKYVNLRPVPAPPPSPKPVAPSNRSLWRQNQDRPSRTPAPFPFNLESFSAPRTKVVHVHHHHYPDSVVDSSEDEAVEEDDNYIEDDYVNEDNYIEDDYVHHVAEWYVDNFGPSYNEDESDEDEFDEDDFNEDDFNEDESDVAFSTSYGEDSDCSSGYDESSS